MFNRQTSKLMLLKISRCRQIRFYFFFVLVLLRTSIGTVGLCFFILLSTSVLSVIQIVTAFHIKGLWPLPDDRNAHCI